MLFLFSATTSLAADNEPDSESAPKVLRVAYPIQKGLTEKDSNGNYSGYTYEYLQEIAQFTGWEYEFVEVPGDVNEALVSMLDMLKNGEVDLIGGLSKNEQTEAMFDFPEYGYGNNYTSLSIYEDNMQINESNLQDVPLLRIAAYKNAKMTKSKVENFCELNSIRYTFIDCESEEEILNAVSSGAADVMVGNDLSPVPGFRTVAQFDSSQFYFAVTKGHSDLLAALNSTILSIKQTKPYFESTLHEKYFSNRSYKTYLTDVEKQHVTRSHPLKIAMVSNVGPIQYQNQKGESAGITKAILDRISEETGIKMEFIPVDTFTQAYAMLETKEANAICGIPYDYTIAQDQNLLMSSELLTAQVVLVSKNTLTSGTSGKTAAVVHGRERDNIDPNVTLKSYDTIKDSLDAVLSDEVDYTYMNLYSAEYLDQNKQYQNLNQIPQPGKSITYCLGIAKPVNSTIITLINRSLSNISPADMETIIYKNTALTPTNVTLRSLVEQNPVGSISILSAIFGIIMIVGISMYRFKTKTSKQLRIENQRYLLLSDFANEYLYEYDFEKDILTFSKVFAKRFSLPEKINSISQLGFEEITSTYNEEVSRIFKEIHLPESIPSSDHLCHFSNGESRWYRNTRAEIRDESGKKVYLIGKLTDIQKEKEETERLQLQSQTDSLTGIRNAASTKSAIKKELATITEPGALMVIDIDKFKEVNDLLGHYTGDIALKDFAQMLTDITRPTDIIGRLGGDEFMCYIRSIPNLDILTDFCERICTSARKVYTADDGRQLTITTSIGATLIDKPGDFSSLYQQADKLLYQSKDKGRDCYTVGTY